MLTSTPDEKSRRDAVAQALLDAIARDEVVHLPDFDRQAGESPAEFALHTIGCEPNPYGGAVGVYRYQFEGEEDLLHLIVTRLDGGALTPEEGQGVAGFVLRGIPEGLIWFKPGERSQHFFVGHDLLPEWLQR